MKKQIDLLEVVLKNKMNIPLTEEEQECLNNTDMEMQEAIKVLLNSGLYQEESNKMAEKIITKQTVKDKILFK